MKNKDSSIFVKANKTFHQQVLFPALTSEKNSRIDFIFPFTQ
jgi:hypothetical protein